ncbi:Branched-chain amino acid transport ATP-binding protein LivF [Candidatus Paraburkholderia kirkii]|nr:Branched-chain amino acid transport ATP-binding protein LivF [Candidatus Paraburkholderia kirkii]
MSISYGAMPAVRGASLQVRRGQVVTLVGANGAGKSTLMKCVAGLIRANAGSVKLDGQEMKGASADMRVKHGLCLVPEGRRLFGSMTVRENLELGAIAGMTLAPLRPISNAASATSPIWCPSSARLPAR